MFSLLKRLTRAAVVKSSTAMADQNEPRPYSVLQTVERWTKVSFRDGPATVDVRENAKRGDSFANTRQSGTENRPDDLENGMKSEIRLGGTNGNGIGENHPLVRAISDLESARIPDAATCRHERVKSCSPILLNIGSNTCAVCEDCIRKFWKVQTCDGCGARKNCAVVVDVSGGAGTAASALGPASSERSVPPASEIDELESRECASSADTLSACARDESPSSTVDETECRSPDGAAGPTCSERRVQAATAAPLEDEEAFENAEVAEKFFAETRADGPTSELDAVKTECPGSSVVSTRSERCVRVTTPEPLEAEAFDNAQVVEECSEETRDVGQVSGLEADETECFRSAVESSSSLERSVQATTTAPLEGKAFEKTQAVLLESCDKTQVIIGDHGLPDVPKNDSASHEEIARLESTVETTEKEQTAVSTTGVNETAVGTNSPIEQVAIDPIIRRLPTVRKEDVRLFTKCKMLPRKNAYWQMTNYMKTVNRFLNKPQEQTSIDHLIKYWIMQNRLFSRFSMGILLDEESFFSVCPEVLSSHIANKCKCETIIDPFCGAGGNIIQFTKTCSRVIGIDVDAKKIELARNNAKVYGVQNRIELRTGDYFQRNSRPKADIVFMSPPWGGPEYIEKPVYSLAGMCSEHGGGRRVLEIAREIAPKIAIHLPRNLDKHECVALARDLNFKYILFENNYIGNKMNSTTMYLK